MDLSYQTTSFRHTFTSLTHTPENLVEALEDDMEISVKHSKCLQGVPPNDMLAAIAASGFYGCSQHQKQKVYGYRYKIAPAPRTVNCQGLGGAMLSSSQYEIQGIPYSM